VPVEIAPQRSPRSAARVAGALYLLYMAASVLADALGDIGLGDAQQVFDRIALHPLSFRLGLLTAFVSALLFLVTAWSLYLLLAPVNRELSLLFLLLNAVGVAVQCISLLALVAALQLGDPAPGALHGLTTVEADALTLWSVGVYKTGFVAAQLFFGAWLFPLGYLIYRSEFLPRLLGALLILDGVAEMVWLVQGLVLPGLPQLKTPGTFVSLLAEVGLALWLLIRVARVAAQDAGTSATAWPPAGAGGSGR